MPLLYVVRHASPLIRPDQPTRGWTLSGRGVREAGQVAGAAAGWDLEAIYSSSETKARATALIIADSVGLNVNVVDALDELHTPDWIANADEFNDLVRRILEGGEDVPRGAETAAMAAERFARGVAIIRQGAFPAAAVTHGRIITAWLTHSAALDDPYTFWRAIPMPGWTMVDLDHHPSTWRLDFAS